MDFLNNSIDIEALHSTIHAMRMQEENGYRVQDYLHQQEPQITTWNCPQEILTGARVDVDCRFRMTQWCYQIIDFCKFKRETVAVAMSNLDRFSCTSTGQKILMDRAKFQLAAMTALYTAIKLQEPEAMEASLVANLSCGVYTKEEIEDMELVMLNAIKWRVNVPTAMAFIHKFLELLPHCICTNEAKDALANFAKFQTEVAVGDYNLSTVNASSVALASLINAFESFNLDFNLRMQFESILAAAASIDKDSYNMQNIRFHLYEIAEKQHSTGLLFNNLATESASADSYSKVETSVHGSPRSVSAAH